VPAKNSKYDPDETPILIEQYARDGMTNEEIAASLGISVRTLYRWQDKYSQVSQALKNGKEVVDAQVERALLKRALGYEYEEKKTYIEETGGRQKKKIEKTIKHIKPNTTAQIFWLKNRKPEQWRNAQPDDREKLEKLVEGMEKNARAVLQQETS